MGEWTEYHCEGMNKKETFDEIYQICPELIENASEKLNSARIYLKNRKK